METQKKLTEQIELCWKIQKSLMTLLIIENHPIAIIEVKKMIEAMETYNKYKSWELKASEEKQFSDFRDLYEEEEARRISEMNEVIDNYNKMEEEEEFRNYQEMQQEFETNEEEDILVGGCATCGQDVEVTVINGNCKNCK